MSARVERWKATWETRDVAAVVAMYAPSGSHASHRVALVWPELGRTTLHGHDEIRAYVQRALARFEWIRFDLVSVTEDPGRSAVEYFRHSNVDSDRPQHVLELLEWQGPLLRAVRVFHAG